MRSFLSDCRKHERSNCHLEAYKKWKTFDATGRVDIIFSRARREEVQRHSEQVRQNKETLKTVSEAVLFLNKQELAFRGNDESNDSLNKEIIGSYLNALENLILPLNVVSTGSRQKVKGYILVFLLVFLQRFEMISLNV